MKKLILVLTVFAAAAAFVPQPAAAQTCTTTYNRCLNETWDTSGGTRLLADLECMAAYMGCVRRLF
jgi:hypothetical protein